MRLWLSVILCVYSVALSVMRKFIRFGLWDKDKEISQIFSHNEPTGTFEKDVSVYEAVYDSQQKEIWRILVPIHVTEKFFDDLHSHLIYSTEPIFLLSGTVVGYGTDGEPLLKNITELKQLDITNLIRKP